MKNIFQRLFSVNPAKKTNKLTAWVNDLQEMDDLTALQFSAKQLAFMLNQTDDQEALNLQQQLDLIIEIEAPNQARLERLSSQFSNVENMKQELENNICEACYNYCRQSYIYHLKVIEKVFDANKTPPENNFELIGNTRILLIARALNIAFNMVKWRLFCQTNPPAKVWLQINMLYRIAAQQMLLNSPIELFDLSPPTTLAALYVQTCMLGQLAQASMQKYHIEIATRILNTLLTRAYISNKFTQEQYLFYIDLEKDTSAKRMRDFNPNENYRCWELDELEKQLTVAVTVSDRGEIPQSLAFSKIDNAKKLNETLRILLEEWKKTDYVRQRRKITRQASSKMAKANAGIVNICNQVHQANQISNGLRLSRDGSSLDDRLRAHTVLRQSSSLSANSGSLDTWIITDISPRGLGTRVNKYANILARPDKLIGLMIDEDPSKAIIGMIRSVKPTQGSQLRVGIEILSHHPTWVQLRQARTDEAFPNTEANIEPLAGVKVKNTAGTVDIGLFSGIYLPAEAGLSDTSMMILPKINYRTNSHYTVTMNGSTKHVLLSEPVECRDDWVLVAFPV
ncbi:MAG: hypothetical protein WBL28_05015 [Methylotenera sp.]